MRMPDPSAVPERWRGEAAPGDVDAQVEAARRGIPGGADALWTSQAPRLVRAALALGVSPEEASDVAQETLLAAFRGLDRFDPARGSFNVWIHTILARRCSNWRRARRRLARALAAVAGEAVPRPPSADRVLRARRLLQRLVGDLTTSQRRAWALTEVAGLSAREAASVLGIREATVRSQVRHARGLMRRKAEEEES